MLNEFLQDRAILYVCGDMAMEERGDFEVLMESEEGLRDFVDDMSEVGGLLLETGPPSAEAVPPPDVKARVMQRIANVPQEKVAPLVVSGTDGLVRWVNAPFMDMCGYTLAELQGRKLGPLLQGADTDAAASARLREAVRECRPCREAVVNYHKNGHAYGVDITLTPVCDDDGQPVLLLAREQELPEHA